MRINDVKIRVEVTSLSSPLTFPALLLGILNRASKIIIPL